ncbi:MAG TPA: CsgG/HfaB family protein, partial [Leptospiraceae bacterium]|nr:CsgG/HfaB family protein [Leptospiraceae bacterium]
MRAKILKTLVEFDSEGSHQNFPKSSVKSIRLKPVVLKPPVTKEEVSEYEKEKVRVAESLQNADWSEGEEGKPRLAVLNFTPGAGVSQAEAETVTYLITTKLVQTKLFIIIDRLTMEKIIREETLKCRQGENCEKKIQNRLGANKILTGNVTKLGSRYFINGNI